MRIAEQVGRYLLSGGRARSWETITEAKVRVKGELRCNATITFGVVPFPHPDLRSHMDAMAKRIGFPQQALGND